MDRYHRQILLPQIGVEGQLKLAEACVLLIGCGALGCTIAEQLTRAGVGQIRIIDRDLVEMTNLQRQVLFDESDARDSTPKALAAAKRLAEINSQVMIEPIVADVHSGNIEEFLAEVQLTIDGTDNAETRYLINDLAVKRSMPWIYGACVGTEGRVMAMCPPTTCCLRCVFDQPPGVGELPTCDTAGVLGPAASVVGSLQAAAAIKFLVSGEIDQQLTTIDFWKGRFHSVSTADAKRKDCRTCGRREFEFLLRPSENTTTLCGANSVQVRPPGEQRGFDLKVAAARLGSAGVVQSTNFLVRCQLSESPGIVLTLFGDGRLIVQGTKDLAAARSLYAKYVGS